MNSSPCALRITKRQQSNTSPVNACKNESAHFYDKIQCAPIKANWKGVKDENVFIADRKVLNPEMPEIMIKPLNLEQDEYKLNKEGFNSPSLRIEASTNHKTL